MANPLGGRTRKLPQIHSRQNVKWDCCHSSTDSDSKSPALKRWKCPAPELEKPTPTPGVRHRPPPFIRTYNAFGIWILVGTIPMPDMVFRWPKLTSDNLEVQNEVTNGDRKPTLVSDPPNNSHRSLSEEEAHRLPVKRGLSKQPSLWLYKAEQDTAFVSNQYKQLDCRTNGLLTLVENAVKPIVGSGYLAYKRISASASCYVDDSWERLKLPFVHIGERFSESSMGFLSKIWKGLQGVVLLTRDFLSNLCWFILVFATDIVTSIGNLFYIIIRNLVDGLILLGDSLGGGLRNLWHLLVRSVQNLKSYAYLLFFAPGNEVKYKVPYDRKEKTVLTGEFENFNSLRGELNIIKRKIKEIEVELRKEEDVRKGESEMLSRQLEENRKTLEKYQTSVNRVLLSSKRPTHFSASSVQYLLDNQSDALKQWITQNFLLKSDSTGLDEEKLSLLLANFTNKSGEELLALRRELAQFVEKHKTDLESLKNNYNLLSSGGEISLANVNKVVGDAIKRYDADKTGKVDYALETAGGQVVSIRCTETYIERPKSYVLLGWPVWSETSSPRDAINPGVAPGQCWAFVGSQGFLVLQLSHTIRVTGFTMEHISKTLVPRGHIESAPKDFSMWGLKHEQDLKPHCFGEYRYLDNDETLQYFPVTFPSNERYNMVELKITSNHGNPNCTCLYRIRVHGDLQPPSL